MFQLSDLDAIIAARAGVADGSSHTGRLLAAGAATCARKFGEEAVETVIAALGEDSEALRDEAADTLYHLLVLLRSRGVNLADVMAELDRRTARSGVAEKAARSGTGG